MNRPPRSAASPYKHTVIPEFYDASMDYIQRQDVSFISGMARRTGGPILDMGCGTGRVLIPLARAGFEVTGLDFAPRMLAACRRKLALEPEEVQARSRIVRGDMRAFRLPRRFRVVVAPYCSFQFLLTVRDQLACLACIRRHLRPEGVLVLDLFNPNVPRMMEMQNRTFGNVGHELKLSDGRGVLRRVRFTAIDTHWQIIDLETVSYVRHADRRRERLIDRLRMRYIYRFEAEHLLARAGFQVEKVYADFDKTPFAGDKAENLILVATKTGRRP